MMKHAKRQHECTSSSSEDEDYHKKLKTSHRKLEKRRKRHYSTSSSSSTSSTSSDSSSSSSSDKYSKKRKKSKKYHEKQRPKKSKKRKSIKPKKSTKTKFKEKKTEKTGTSAEVSCDIPIGLMDKSMTPMTKEQWEKQQSIVRRVFDEATGRHRLIKGDGEVIEEIVSRDRHKQINQQATRGDGEYFQANLKHLNIRK